MHLVHLLRILGSSLRVLAPSLEHLFNLMAILRVISRFRGVCSCGHAAPIGFVFLIGARLSILVIFGTPAWICVVMADLLFESIMVSLDLVFEVLIAVLMIEVYALAPVLVRMPCVSLFVLLVAVRQAVSCVALLICCVFELLIVVFASPWSILGARAALVDCVVVLDVDVQVGIFAWSSPFVAASMHINAVSSHIGSLECRAIAESGLLCLVLFQNSRSCLHSFIDGLLA